MNDAAPPDVPETPAEVTDLQRRTLSAYERSRTRFEAWCSRPPTPNPAGDIDIAQLRHMRYRNAFRPYQGDAIEAMHLVGAIGRLDGGQSLSEPDGVTRADLIGAWCTALVQVGDIAITWRLALSPLLNLAAHCASSANGHPSLAASCVDLSVITTAYFDPDRSAEHVDSERRAMFGALGQVTTCALVVARNAIGWPRDMTAGTFYTGAVEMLLGAEGR